MGSPFLIIERVAPERKKTLPPWPNTSSQPLSWLPSPSLTTTVPTLLPRVGMQLPAQPMPPLLPRATVPQTPATELLLPNTPPTLTSSPMTLTRLPLTMVEISSICQRSSSCSHFSLPSLPPSLWPSSLPLSLAFSSTLRSAFSEAFSGLFLDVVVGEGPSVFELLASEDQPLLVRGDALLVLDVVVGKGPSVFELLASEDQPLLVRGDALLV